MSGAEPRGDLAALAGEAQGCTRCALFARATQTVFGEGPPRAPVVLVGEQPGDQEDRRGRPFVGPAGRLLDRALAEAGIDRRRIYVTNAVKHFKFVRRGERRIHEKPNAGEIAACRWWLDRELALIAPQLTVALGATAVAALLGKAAPLSGLRGHAVAFSGRAGLVTVHPSYLLRVPDPAARAGEFHRFVADLARIGEIVPQARLAA